MILAGDLGGTKTVLALFSVRDGTLHREYTVTRETLRYRSLAAMLREFLAEGRSPQVEVACLGVAGPVLDGRCKTTNLPWVFTERELATECGIPRVKLLNDLEATAFGTGFVSPDDLLRLDDGGVARSGNVAVVAAGTGLGEAMLIWDGQQHHPVASEGGHVEFASRTEQEFALLRYLRTQVGDHVSYERIVSGPGLVHIYRFLRAEHGSEEPQDLRRRMADSDPSAAITRAALAGEDPVCAETLHLFCSIYGAEAGNLALKCLAFGGVFIAGGIAPKILPVLRAGGFMDSFTCKGRFTELMRRIPVSVVLTEQVGLLGAAHYARRLQVGTAGVAS